MATSRPTWTSDTAAAAKRSRGEAHGSHDGGAQPRSRKADYERGERDAGEPVNEESLDQGGALVMDENAWTLAAGSVWLGAEGATARPTTHDRTYSAPAPRRSW